MNNIMLKAKMPLKPYLASFTEWKGNADSWQCNAETIKCPLKVF
jgi:hypothetical protein